MFWWTLEELLEHIRLQSLSGLRKIEAGQTEYAQDRLEQILRAVQELEARYREGRLIDLEPGQSLRDRFQTAWRVLSDRRNETQR